METAGLRLFFARGKRTVCLRPRLLLLLKPTCIWYNYYIMTMEKILDAIRSGGLIRKNQHIVLGLSGGPDSVCLFHALLRLSAEMNLTVHPVHVNHRLRPGAAEEDQRFVEEICEQAGCPCRTFVFDCAFYARRHKITSEEAGRKLRYEAFAAVTEELCAEGIEREEICIAVAQNADDQAETILFRLLRGSGTEGLAGIRAVRADEHGNKIVRPLLYIPRKEIISYCKKHGLNPRIDETNQLPVYSRNKIRLQLFPYLEREYNPEIKDTMIRMGKNAAMDADYIRQQARQAYSDLVLEKSADHVLLCGAMLRELHRAVRQRIIAMAFGEIGLRDDLTFAHFEQCETIVFHGGPSARCDLPRGYYLTKVYGDVRAAVRREKEKRDFRMEVMSKEFGAGFEERIRLAPREKGDFIAISGGKHKKIQDLFVDLKVPKDRRDSAELLKIGSQVLWVPPVEGKGRYSANFKLSAATKKVICIEIIW